METIIKTKEEIKQSLKNILYWDNDLDLDFAIDTLSKGESIVIDAISYIGNGKWVNKLSKNRYKYKMIVPIMDKNNNLYSTDLFEGDIKNAICGKYGIYRATRQKCVNVVAKVDTNYSLNRFDFGYKDGIYGIYGIYK